MDAIKDEMMSKLTKTQRREKQKKERRSQGGGRTKKQEALKAWEAPKMKLFEMPKLLKDEVSREQRMNLVKNIGERARAEFDEKFPNLHRWLTDYDPVYVLAMCAFYLCSTPEGKDPEAVGELDFPHHYLEIMQAFALYQTRNSNLNPLQLNLKDLKEEWAEIGQVMSLRHLAIPDHLTSDDEIDAYRLRTEMMGQTTAVRNWAYPHQLRKVVLDLSEEIKSEFFARYGVDPTSFFTTIFKLVDERNDLLNDHITKIKDVCIHKDYKRIISAYNEAFPENKLISESDADDLWDIVGGNKEVLCSMLMAHADLKLEEIYSFTAEHVYEIHDSNDQNCNIKNMLDLLSHEFGDLANFNKDHIVLSNPVLSSPFIKLGSDLYFTAVWAVVPHIAIDMLERLVWSDEALKLKYTRAKSKYLEDQLEAMMRRGFPNANIYRGSLWKDPSDGKEYENDLLVVLDGFALVLEAKSATITDPARRGAPARLTDTLRELIEEPSKQAHRFIQYLENNQQVHRLRTKSNEINNVDSSSIRYYIPLGITLSNLGSIASNLKKLIKAGVTKCTLEELAPSISITDLESVMELLPLEVEKVHYFARRREFEAHMDYEGDELDLLGFYLDTGFNIGQHEYEKNIAINMLLKSKELDPFFVGSYAGVNVAKPTLAMTVWWRDILAQISQARRDGWVEAGFILLNVPKEDQEKFENEFKALVHRLKTGNVDMPHNFVIGKFGPERRRYILAGYPYKSTDIEVRNSVIDEFVHSHFSEEVRGVAVIGLNIDAPNYPYSVFARKASTNLFDVLTL